METCSERVGAQSVVPHARPEAVEGGGHDGPKVLGSALDENRVDCLRFPYPPRDCVAIR